MAIIYVSSSLRDLKKCRKAALRVIKTLGHESKSMETYPAFTRPALIECLEDVEQSELYIGIFARRYGSIPGGETESFTDLEYLTAKDKKIPSLIFLLDENVDWETPPEDEEAKNKLKKLRKELEATDSHTPKFFRDVKELRKGIREAILEALKHKPINIEKRLKEELKLPFRILGSIIFFFTLIGAAVAIFGGDNNITRLVLLGIGIIIFFSIIALTVIASIPVLGILFMYFTNRLREA